MAIILAAEQLYLFGDPLKLVAESEASIDFKNWAFLVGAEIVEKSLNLIKAERGNSAAEALEYLNWMVSHNSRTVISFRRDIARKGQPAKSRKIISDAPTGDAPIDLQCGGLSHSLILDLMTGVYPGQQAQMNFGFQPPAGFDVSNVESLLFSHKQTARVNESLLWEASQGIFSTKGGEFFKVEEQIKAVQHYLAELAPYASLPGWANRSHKKYNRLVKEFKRTLEPLVGGYVNRLPLAKDTSDEYLLFLTLVIWGQAIVETLEKPESFPYIFKEVRILPSWCGFDGGRADGLKVVLINGHPPTIEERLKLDSFYQGSPRPTIGELVEMIFQVFGLNVTLEPIDLKISVGDGNHRILKSDMPNPVVGHQRQLEQYVFLSALSHFLVQWEAQGALADEIWKPGLPISRGELVYCYANSRSQIFGIDLNWDQQRLEFIRRVVLNWRQAEVFARFRQTDAVIARCLEGAKDVGQRKIRPKNKSQLLLPMGNNGLQAQQTIMAQIVEQLRQYVDSGKTIEIIGYQNRGNKKGQPIYLLHLDSLPDGRFIPCPFPDHDDPGPSTCLWPGPDGLSGTFHCFGASCGKTGFWILDGADSISFEVKVRQGHHKKTQKIESLVIPDEHHQVMGLVQEVLQENFSGPASSYLAKVRKLNPDLAFQYGAGYADGNFCLKLLERGLTFEQLEFYGLIGFSKSISPKSAFIQRLSRLYPLEELSRQKKGLGRETNQVWPYDALAGRVTSPLTVGGKIVNFYGRDILNRGKAYKHRKLGNALTKLPHGAFNMEALASAKKTVVVTEGVMDTLALLEMGEPNVMAAIGFHSAIILGSLLKCGKTILWALDIDPPDEKHKESAGQKRTQELIEEFGKSGVKTFNYLDQFREIHPEIMRYDDYSAWWEKEGHKQKI